MRTASGVEPAGDFQEMVGANPEPLTARFVASGKAEAVATEGAETATDTSPGLENVMVHGWATRDDEYEVTIEQNPALMASGWQANGPELKLVGG